MASETLPHGSLRLGVLGLSMAGLLMGCVEGGGSGSGTQGKTTAAPAAFRAGGDREVEAPEVFQVTDSGLWDGRPSLGGIWVASPNAVDPERVVIVNPATGKSVNGALFRRERDNPGPSLQISSDAAEALGILAGQPTTISVTALRKRSEPAPAAAAEATEVAAAAPAESEDAAATTEGPAAETAALAAAALAATGAATEGATVAAAASADGAVEGTVEGTVEAAAEPAKPKTWKERRAEAKARREAEKAAKAAAAAEAEAAKAAAEGTAVAAGAVAETAATAENAAVATVETAPLDARTAEVTAAADAAATTAGEAPAEPKKTRRQLREEKKAAEAAAAAAAAEAAAADPAAAAPAAEAATGRSIQIASYSKESNATRAVETLAKIGITGQISKTERDGKTVWSVVTRGDEAQLTAIKGAGFADAFFLQ